MCRKRWWRGGSELLVLFMLHHVILGDGDIGCLFSKSLCDPQTETCYNDLAFGRCLPSYTDLSNEDYYQYDFNVDELELLRLQLERLQIDGYKWSHPYTQCVMKTLLYNLRHRKIIDLQFCLRLKDTHLENNNEMDEDKEPTIAIVKFTPDNSKFNNQFAKELYYPPSTQNQYYSESIYNDEPPRSPYKEQFRETDSQLYNPNSYNEYDSLTNDESYDENDSREKPTLGKVNERLYRIRREPWEYNDYEDKNEAIRQYLEMQKRILEDSLTEDESDYDYSDKEKRKEENVDYAKTFSKKYKPKKFNTDSDTNELFLKRENVKRSSDNYYDIIDSILHRDDFDLPDKPHGRHLKHIHEVYDNDNDDYDSVENELKEYFRRGGLSGFKRRERLDVKKPGPQFSTNNYAFKTETPSEENENENESENRSETEQDSDVLTPHEGNNKRGKEVDDKQVESTNIYDNVDLDHVYVEFQKPFHTWEEGEHVVEEVSKLLELTPGSLKDTRVGRAEVTFKIASNNKNYSANDVVHNIGKIRDKLKETLDVEVVRAGIGDKTKLPAILEVKKKPEMSSGMFGAIVAVGVAAAVTAAVITLVIARRHARSRAKLAGLDSDPEASKDYQDLCRARMHAKQPTMDKPESPRITILSKDNDSNNLPSNRSSTSSWGDEPALSNMDISTGKMVLSYMEDHLQNKDRLDQEWAALCAYEVDPSSTDIAQSEVNAKKNRPGAPLPYDHSRVILNDFANANGSDYINASTITDHDPRNPAYIATQGPLPHTTADFWQLVWEQGSVVIVMLTRLTEEGVAMCHRYWPEEGSELHHIYEVHLVSEHLWCDDYLVRSFYLKNLHTGETRTVTQFHFLSWPENNVPHSTKALLEFRRKINKSYKGRSCPIVVHCSDGAGRTGTYCLIDMVLNSMMKGAKEIDIAATLEHIRDQRPGMVSTNQQFKFVLMAVAEEVHATLKALPIPPAEKSSLPGNSSSTKEDQ